MMLPFLRLLLIGIAFNRRATAFSPLVSNYGSRGPRRVSPRFSTCLQSQGGWHTCLSRDEDPSKALQEVMEGVTNQKPSIAFLFVSVFHTSSFTKIVEDASALLGPDTDLLALIGGGVVGGGAEVDEPRLPAISLLCGTLPGNSKANLFSFNAMNNPPPEPASPFWKRLGERSRKTKRVPSFILFTDPWAPIDDMLKAMQGCVVAGGISVPASTAPTIGINGKALPQGSAVGVCLSGDVGLQAIVAQGCRGVGPAFTITKCGKHEILELNGRPALEVLEEVGREASDEDKKLISTGYYLVGISPPPEEGVKDVDFLIRQIMGFKPDKGAILVGAGLEEGDLFRFHVRDGKAALSDMELMMKRTQTERMFAGKGKTGRPVAAVQVSCVGRGKSLFQKPNVDLSNVGQLFGDSDENDDKPIAGFYANGEIGPVGISGFSGTPYKSFMHGFTTVTALICDFSETRELVEQSAEDSKTVEDAWG